MNLFSYWMVLYFKLEIALSEDRKSLMREFEFLTAVCKPGSMLEKITLNAIKMRARFMFRTAARMMDMLTD